MIGRVRTGLHAQDQNVAEELNDNGVQARDQAKAAMVDGVAQAFFTPLEKLDPKFKGMKSTLWEAIRVFGKRDGSGDLPKDLTPEQARKYAEEYMRSRTLGYRKISTDSPAGANLVAALDEQVPTIDQTNTIAERVGVAVSGNTSDTTGATLGQIFAAFMEDPMKMIGAFFRGVIAWITGEENPFKEIKEMVAPSVSKDCSDAVHKELTALSKEPGYAKLLTPERVRQAVDSVNGVVKAQAGLGPMPAGANLDDAAKKAAAAPPLSVAPPAALSPNVNNFDQALDERANHLSKSLNDMVNVLGDMVPADKKTVLQRAFDIMKAESKELAKTPEFAETVDPAAFSKALLARTLFKVSDESGISADEKKTLKDLSQKLKNAPTLDDAIKDLSSNEKALFGRVDNVIRQTATAVGKDRLQYVSDPAAKARMEAAVKKGEEERKAAEGKNFDAVAVVKELDTTLRQKISGGVRTTLAGSRFLRVFAPNGEKVDQFSNAVTDKVMNDFRQLQEAEIDKLLQDPNALKSKLADLTKQAAKEKVVVLARFGETAGNAGRWLESSWAGSLAKRAGLPDPDREIESAVDGALEGPGVAQALEGLKKLTETERKKLAKALTGQPSAALTPTADDGMKDLGVKPGGTYRVTHADPATSQQTPSVPHLPKPAGIQQPVVNI